MFARFGELEAITTYPGRNYAFVSYVTLASAVAALLALSGTPTGSSALRLEFAKTGTPSRMLCVSGLALGFSRAQWAALFERYGPLASVAFNDASKSALVEYASISDAVAANNALQGVAVAGSVLKVVFEAPAPPKTQLGAPRTVSSRGGAAGADDPPEVPTSCLWVGLPGGSSVTEADLRTAFSACQGVTRVKAFPDRNYGFVGFTCTLEAAAAKAVLHNRVVGDARLTIKYALNPGGGSQRARVGPQTHRSDSSPRSPSRDRPPAPAVRGGLDSAPKASDGYVKLVGGNQEALVGLPAQPSLGVRVAASEAHAVPSPAGTPPAALIAPWSDPRRGAQADAPSPEAALESLPSWQGTLGKCGVTVCRLTAVRGSTAALPAVLDCSARSDLAPLAAYLAVTPFVVAELAPSAQADCASLGAFLAALGELQRAGVVRGAGSLIFLVPPCEWAGQHLHCAPTANLLAVCTAAPPATDAG